MRRPCMICAHERHDEVEAALLNNEPYVAIARRFGTSVMAVLSHRSHLSTNSDMAATEPNPVTALDVLDQMQGLERNCFTLLEMAEGASEMKVVFSALGQVRKNLESVVELTAQLGKELKARI